MITGGTPPDGSKPPLSAYIRLGTPLLPARLARYLPSQPLYGLQAQGVKWQPTSCTDVMDMAAHYIKEIYTIQPLALIFCFSFEAW